MAHLSCLEVCCIVTRLESFMKKLCGAILLLCASVTWSQSRVEDGGHEVQLWTGGGYSVPGGTSDTGISYAVFCLKKKTTRRSSHSPPRAKNGVRSARISTNL